MTNPAPAHQIYISGYSYNCQTHTGSEMYAIDFGLGTSPNGPGDPVGSIARGVVNATGFTDAGGNYISIKGDDGYYSYYGHLSSLRKSTNDRVREGDQIAISGNSTGAGYSAGYHMHFSIHSGSTFGTAVMPEPLGGINHYTGFQNYIGPGITGCPGGSLGSGPYGGFQATAPAVAVASTYYSGDYFLDGYGAIHPANGAPALTSDGSWPGWNIARDFKICPSDDSKGYMLDEFGGIHAVGNAPTVPNDSSHMSYWTGWDIARSIAVLPDCQSGYVMDGWGGIHGFAASLPKPADPTNNAYWPGQDIAKAMVIALPYSNPGSGYTLDYWGGVHEFGPFLQWLASPTGLASTLPGEWS